MANLMMNRRRIVLDNPHLVEPTPANPLSFDTDMVAPLKCQIAFNPVQDLNGYQYPWPAGGNAGKNLFDESTIYHGYYHPSNGPTSLVAGEAYRTATLTLPAGTYTFSTDLANPYILRVWYDGTNHSITKGVDHVTFTTTTEGTVSVCWRNTSTSTITATIHTMVEAGSVATAYTPYSANICPITGWTGANVYREDEYDAEADPTVTVSWQDEAGIIYGGELDVTTGVLTATMATKTLDDALNWSKSSAGNVYYATSNGTNFPYAFKSDVAALSDKYKFDGVASSGYNSALSNGEFLLYYSSTSSNVREIAFKNESISTLDAWKTAVHANPIQIVYELATPVTYQLTPQQINTLLGKNNIWANVNGNISVKYWKH